MTKSRLDALCIALLAAVSLALIIANVFLQCQFTVMSFPLIGIIAYSMYIRLGDYDIHINCDYIQSGEAAVGSFALFATLAFVSRSPYVAFLLVFLALLAYQLYLRAAIAPDKKELAVNGAVAQAILLAIAAFIISGGFGPRTLGPRLMLFGFSPSMEASFVSPTGALLLVALLFFFTWAFKLELGLFSLGPAFSRSSAPVRAGISAVLIAARSALLAVTVFFSGWICSAGFSIHRLYRGRQADAITLLSLICSWQIITLLDRLAGPWYAVASIYMASYVLLMFYLNKRVYLYDRYQQP